MNTQFLNTSGGQIAYEVSGSGPLVVCVPGMGDLRGEYRFLTPLLVQAGFRVASMDIRGHGESSTRWSDFSVAGIGSDILALIRALSSGPAFIIGTSMAAGAAIWAAAEAPALVSGIALLGPAVRGEVNPSMGALLRVLFSRPWGAWAWKTYYTSLFPTRKPADFQAYRAALIDNLRQPGRLEALQNMMLANKTASEERLEKVSAPAVVIMGTKDPDFPSPEEEARWLAGKLNAAYSMIEGAGHYPHVEMLDASGPLLVSWLESQREKAYVA